VPDDFELFAQLHLGLLPDGTAQEQNLAELARRLGLGLEALLERLRAARIDPLTVEDTDYDLSGQHAEAQVLALLGDAPATLAFARRVYDEYRGRLGHKRPRFDDEFLEKTVSDKIEISDVPRRRS
jgi:hypothetical protein